jgi:hypothetical protein
MAFCPTHEPRAILVFGHRIPVDGRRKARPAGAGIELVSDENSGVPQHACKCQSVSLGVERIGECALGAVLSCHPVLLGRELLFARRPISRPWPWDCPFLALLNPAGRNTWVRMHRQPESLIVRTDGSLRGSSLFDTSEIV